MKAVMISIQPQWAEKIANGQKTIEVRKTRPKIDTPFKCYIYCTKAKSKAEMLSPMPFVGGVELGECLDKYRIDGKVIGHFVCDRIYNLVQAGAGIMFADENLDLLEPQMFRDMSCLTDNQLSDYLDNKDGFAWHITDLVIYDEPRELGEFWAYNAELNKQFNRGEDYCAWGSCETENGCLNDCDTENILHCYQCWADWSGWCHRLTRPPESWRYIDV